MEIPYSSEPPYSSEIPYSSENIIPASSQNAPIYSSEVLQNSTNLFLLSNPPTIIQNPKENNNIKLTTYKKSVKSSIPYFQPKIPYNMCLNLDVSDVKPFNGNGYGINNKFAKYMNIQLEEDYDEDYNNVIKSFNNI